MKQQLIDFLEFKFHLYRYTYLKNLFHKIRVKDFMSKDEKKLFDIKLRPNSIIFDVGGYEGNFTDRLLHKNSRPHRGPDRQREKHLVLLSLRNTAWPNPRMTVVF